MSMRWLPVDDSAVTRDEDNVMSNEPYGDRPIGDMAKWWAHCDRCGAASPALRR